MNVLLTFVQVLMDESREWDYIQKVSEVELDETLNLLEFEVVDALCSEVFGSGP